VSEARVSVVMPLYNGERYVAAAVESALAQRPAPLEVIVVDDGSLDDGRGARAAQACGPSVRVVLGAHAGIGAARNAGLAAARGDLLAFLDADDLWEPGKTAAQLAALEADPALDMVFGHALQFKTPDMAPEVAARLEVPTAPMPGMVPGAGLFRRTAFERTGPFETQWKVGEFVSWYQRAMDLGLRAKVIPELVLRRRVHGGNQGIKERGALADYARIVKAALDRRRGRGS